MDNDPGDWGLGIGDWGLGIGPIPNPQSPIPNYDNKNCLKFLGKLKFIFFSKIKHN